MARAQKSPKFAVSKAQMVQLNELGAFANDPRVSSLMSAGYGIKTAMETSVPSAAFLAFAGAEEAIEQFLACGGADPQKADPNALMSELVACVLNQASPVAGPLAGWAVAKMGETDFPSGPFVAAIMAALSAELRAG